MNFEDLNIYQQYAFYRILNDISFGYTFVDICSENDEILDLFYNEILKKFSTVKELKLDDFIYDNKADLIKNKVEFIECIKESYKRHFALIARDAEKFFQRVSTNLEENQKFSLINYGFFHARFRDIVACNSMILLGKGEEWMLGGLMEPNTSRFIHPYYLDDSGFLTEYGSLSESEAKECVNRLSNDDYDEKRKTFVKRCYGEGKTL